MAWQEDDEWQEGAELSRAGDPIQSRNAGREAAQSGQVQSDRILAKQLVYRCQNKTARELNHINGTPEGTIHRRLAELEKMGLIERGPERVSIIDGKPVGRKAATWRAPTGEKQQELFR